mmetsp:Transcript_16214/g.23846  ORF Transcript_16214/g.23846 Transcript_16214/m.23846 type:complete len:433 (+) Transcript_16214:53-1351(+)
MNRTTWLEGVRLWYNDQDYFGAIEVWQDGLNNLIDWNDEEEDHLSIFSLSDYSYNIHRGNDVARLLLFLAGCQLDAQQKRLARLSLIFCLRCCHGFDLTAQLAAQELICSYEEDIHDNIDGEKSIKLCRKIVEFAIKHDCSYWVNKYQRPGFMCDSIKLYGKPYYERDVRPSWCNILEEEKNWTRIRDEFYRLTRGGSSRDHLPSVGAGNHRGGAGEHDHKVVDGDWREVVLFGSGARPELAPFTSSLIRTCVPEATSLSEQGGGEVIFSVLGPNTRIRSHCGSTNLRLTAHLGLSVPFISEKEEKSACAIRVADKWLTWEEGRVLVFDDSFEHQVNNMTLKPRVVLLLRFWHPDFPQNERAQVLEKVVDAKQLDSLRRYNPPLPSGTFDNVERRGLELDRCPVCRGSGYSCIRLMSIDDPTFNCSCGYPID